MPLATPVATVLAYALYEHVTKSMPADQRKKGKEGDATLLEHVDKTIETTLQAEQRDIAKNKGNLDYLTWLRHNLYNARYCVAGALGFGVGLAGA